MCGCCLATAYCVDPSLLRSLCVCVCVCECVCEPESVCELNTAPVLQDDRKALQEEIAAVQAGDTGKDKGTKEDKNRLPDHYRSS